VTVQNVGAGHPLLAPAAVAAVQQWKYEPTKVSGEPVDVQAKVFVTFEFNQQQGRQKQCFADQNPGTVYLPYGY